MRQSLGNEPYTRSIIGVARLLGDLPSLPSRMSYGHDYDLICLRCDLMSAWKALTKDEADVLLYYHVLGYSREETMCYFDISDTRLTALLYAGLTRLYCYMKPESDSEEGIEDYT